MRGALSAVRYARRTDSPLARLTVVEARLRDDGIDVTPENAQWALHGLLDDLVAAELVRLRGPGRSVDRAKLTPEIERSLLEADFGAGTPELEGWSTLFVRYLSTSGIQMDELPELVGVSRATIARRLSAAVSHLTDRLRAVERDALAVRDRRAARPATERIVIAEPDEDEDPVTRAASELIAVARSDHRIARVSADHLTALSRRSPDDLDGYRVGRVAEWSLPRYRLDDRFVDLSLLIDQGEEDGSGRWQVQERRFPGLSAVLSSMTDPALVLLGPPGSGKSTLMRRLELELSMAGLRGEVAPITFMIPLNLFRADRPGAEPPSPHEWLAAQWSARYPDMPALDSFMSSGGLLLLLDALNEMPHVDQAEYRSLVAMWKQFVHSVVVGGDNRVVLSCRSLEYSAPISTPELRVPQVRIEPLADEQVERFLHLYCPASADAMWRGLEAEGRVDLVRSPYFLRLFVDHVTASGEVPRGRAALFTGFVRQALRREVVRDNPLFQPGALLSDRDYNRVVRVRKWGTPHELPERGQLFPSLSRLAYRMQRGEPLGEAAQVRVPYDAALSLMEDVPGEDVVRAGVSMAVVDEDTGRDEVLFVHQLLQEYFAGRYMAGDLDADLVLEPWRADAQVQGLGDVLPALGRAEPLPALPLTNWEETTQLASEITPDKPAFIERLLEANVALAGRCAAQETVREHLPTELVDRLRHALVERSQDTTADLRARIGARLALGRLGDPGLSDGSGPDGSYLLPRLVVVEAGRCEIGSDETYSAIGKTFDDQTPRHAIEMDAFRIAVHPVTHAEYQRFVEAGGYDDERWWETPTDKAWRRGVGTASGERQRYHYWAGVFRVEPSFLEELVEYGRVDDEAYEKWQRWISLDSDALEDELKGEFPDAQHAAPDLWADPAFSNPSQPVVGVSWFEARAYCQWLSAQSDLAARLPTEAEWEIAASGPEGRHFAWGGEPDVLRCNVMETHIQRPVPVCVFPHGDTPDGIADLNGNVSEWTSSRWGGDPESPEFRYPYAPDDGREAPEAPADCRRVLRGGAFYAGIEDTTNTFRGRHHPTARDAGIGFRIVVSGFD